MLHATIARVVVCALACMAGGVAAAQDTITLRIADQFPLTHQASKLTILPVIDEIEKRSGGRIKFEHYPAEQLAKATGMLDAVRNGVADMALQVAGQVSDRLPLSTVVELPSVSDDILECYKAFQTLADGPLLEREYLPLGVRAVEVNCTPPQFLTTKAREIASLADLSGLKLRSGGTAVDVTLSGVGAVPIKLGAPEIYVGIERGTLDGAIFAASSSLGYKLETICQGVAQNVSFGSNAAILFINEAKFQSLPKDLQKIILDVGHEVGASVAGTYNSDSARALGVMKDAGMNVYDLPADVVAAIKAAQEKVTLAWIDQIGGRGLPAQEIVDAARTAAKGG